MRFLHSSDWHLGMSFRSISALEDQEHFADQICRIAAEENVDAVLLAGDIFDRSIASAEAVSLYDRIMTRLAGTMGIPVLAVAGNHDSPERLAQCSSLLQRAGLHLCGALGPEIRRVEFEDTDVYLLPWTSTEKVRSLWPDRAEEIVSTEDAYRLVCSKIRESFRPGRKNVLLTHAFVVKGETSVSDRAAEIGFAAAVSGDVFEGFDYVALGHLHKPQIIDGRLVYSGSPMAYSFGTEETQTKGVVIADTADGSIRNVPLEPLHERHTVSGTREEVLNAAYTPRQRDAYVRADITDTYIGTELAARLREIFPNLLEARGRSFGEEEGAILMTPEELNALSDDPLEIFRRYCREAAETEPDEHLLTLFKNALSQAQEAAE